MWNFLDYLPTTCKATRPLRVENDGASAVTSHEKLPDNPNWTFLMTTWVAFDEVVCVNKNSNIYFKLN